MFSDREKLSPQEGTNQSRPEGLPLHGVALLPLFKRLRDPVKQFLYTDDSAAEVENLIMWRNDGKRWKTLNGVWVLLICIQD